MEFSKKRKRHVSTMEDAKQNKHRCCKDEKKFSEMGYSRKQIMQLLTGTDK